LIKLGKSWVKYSHKKGKGRAEMGKFWVKWGEGMQKRGKILPKKVNHSLF
jgi:hypothetical protein